MGGDLWAPVDVTHPVVGGGTARLRRSLAEVLERGASLAGWKVGWNDPGVRAQLGVPTGAVGYLLEQTTAATSSWPLGGLHRPMAEIEVAAVLGDVVGPEDEDERVLSAVAALAPAVEVLDLVELSAADAIAGNLWHAGAVLGGEVPFDGARPPALQGTSWKGDGTPRPLPGAPRLVHDLPAILRFVAGGALVLGAALSPGHVVLCGNLAGAAIAVRSGDVLTGDLGDLGRVTVTFRDL